MSVEIMHSDCLAILPTLAANSLDACVTDPPYGLAFMGRKWDDDVAFRAETWSQVLRVLKPGAHLLAFGGTRNAHRMVCAIEDAGFEIRDSIMWVYGSGFPKSHDIGKAIDKAGGQSVAWFGSWFREWRETNKITQKQVARLFPSKSGGITGCVANWELGLNIPTPEQFNLIRDTFGLPFPSIEAAAREITGTNDRRAGWFTSGDGHDITAPATDAAKQWNGWGTNLKPSHEPVCVARKPLSEPTIAANVLRHGTGALNIDATRIDGGIRPDILSKPKSGAFSGVFREGSSGAGKTDLGRWPPNLAHDGSDEVMAAFGAFGNKPSCNSPSEAIAAGEIFKSPRSQGVIYPGETGSAARFFYSAKATADDRLNSKHPTVKPVTLMRWLIRLVTPPGGTVLDPFAGSGTTGMAAMAEGFNAVLIEQDAAYVADIRRRLAHVSGADTPLFSEVTP